MTVSELLDRAGDFSQLSQKEQVKLVSYFFCLEHKIDSFIPSQIRECFVAENIRLPSNIHNEFKKLTDANPPTFIKKGNGYTFERNTKKELDLLFLNNPHKQIVSSSLRDLISKIKSQEQQVFLEEAISCFEIKSYRAAILMTWLLTVDTLYEHVINSKLADFNNAVQAHGKYKKVSFFKKEQFSDIKESDFIELLRVAKVITGDTKKILDEKLDFRNTCAHPNSVIIKESKAISFIEDLIENIISKY